MVGQILNFKRVGVEIPGGLDIFTRPLLLHAVSVLTHQESASQFREGVGEAVIVTVDVTWPLDRCQSLVRAAFRSIGYPDASVGDAVTLE